MPPIRVLIIADDPLARAGLATLLGERPSLNIVGQSADDEGLLTDLDVYRPDVVLWDLGWDTDGLPDDFAEVELPIVALLPHDGLAAEAWALGARGLLPRDARGSALEIALQAVAREMIVLEPAFSDAIRTPLPPDELPPGEALTPREEQVLQLLAEGLSNRAIGQELSISEHTVKFHVNAIMGKLSAQSRTEAVVRATRLGLIVL